MKLVPIYDEFAEPQGLGFRDYLAIVQRRRGTFLGILALAAAIGLSIVVLSKPVYETETKLVVPVRSNSARSFDPNNPMTELFAAAQPETLDAQLQVLQSWEFVEKARNEAGIANHPGKLAPIVRAEALEQTKDDMQAILITVEGQHPGEIVRLANTMASLYVKQADLVTLGGLNKMLRFVRHRRDQATGKLADAERRLLLFRQAHGGVELTTEREARTSEYSALMAKVLESESNITTVTAELASLKDRLAKEPFELVEMSTKENPRVVKLRDKLDELNFHRMDLLRDFNPESRQVQDLNEQIARVQRQLNAEPEETHVRLHSFNPARISLRTRLDELEANLRGYQETHRSALAQLRVKRQTLNELGPWEAELARLNRARDVAQSSYTQLAERLQDLDFRMGGRTPTARVIDKAYPPDRPIRPRKALALALSCLLGLMLASGIVCLLELAGDRISSPAEAGRLLGLPSLGHVPTMAPGQPRLVTAMSANSPVAEAYRALRSSIGFACRDAPIRRLQITSASQGEGKSTTSVNLATAMASNGSIVVLVDADLRSPSAHQLLGLPNSIGLSEVLRGACTLDDALQAAHIDNLLVLTAGAIPPNPAEMLGSSTFDHLLDVLQGLADIVILDTSACIPVTDPVIVAARMDAVALVVRVGKTTNSALKHALGLLSNAHARILGVLFNQAPPGSTYYYDYHPLHQAAISNLDTHRTPAKLGHSTDNGHERIPSSEITSFMATTPGRFTNDE